MCQHAIWGALLTPLFIGSAASGEETESDSPDFPRCVIAVDEQHTIRRSDVKNDSGASLSWVIRKDGEVVLERNARQEHQFKYFREDSGVYTVHVRQIVDGAYRVISNVISYRIRMDEEKGSYPCHLFVSRHGVVNRSLVDGELSAHLVWVVELNGQQVLKKNAENSTQFRYSGRNPGRYQISVQRIADDECHRISNVVTYVIKRQ